MGTSNLSLLPSARIENTILMIRGHKVILDRDLADLYGVQTRIFNQAVVRNRNRFPHDFMFQLTKPELEHWRSQIVISNPAATMSLRTRPYAFTEQGVAMLSGVLRSKRAVQVNIQIMRTFVQLRKLIATHEDLARKIAAMERKYDKRFKVVFDTIRQLMKPPTDSDKNREIGFKP